MKIKPHHKNSQQILLIYKILLKIHYRICIIQTSYCSLPILGYKISVMLVEIHVQVLVDKFPKSFAFVAAFLH